MASIYEVAPDKKATAFVKEVMVIDGPEWLKAFYKRSLAGKSNEI